MKPETPLATARKAALVTGVTGQDGAYLTEFLLQKGYVVHGIKRRSSSFNTGRLDDIYQDPHEPDPQLVLHYGDMTDATYARLTQAFSKKVENHVYAFALHTMYHNFVKISGAHRMTPAQAAKVDSRLWEIGDIVKMVEEWELAEN